ncbi:hypothetical protein CC78DRAFT_13104 [Lojkania enalia]|uniref:Secreted protein n=1 Tax=Lojkania enalia TaxID=147567 RepID=A0A9P4NDC5_9PLEO|nr:hypothetical protein CC78DRAFT_13104 [Didymosphaeria enalia]
MYSVFLKPCRLFSVTSLTLILSSPNSNWSCVTFSYFTGLPSTGAQQHRTVIRFQKLKLLAAEGTTNLWLASLILGSPVTKREYPFVVLVFDTVHANPCVIPIVRRWLSDIF